MSNGTILAATAAADPETFTCDGVICRGVGRLSNNSDLLAVVDALSAPFNILLILVVAWLAMRLTRRAIRRAVSGLHGEQVQARLAILRRRTPRALQHTAQNTSLRRAQRAETIGALFRSISVLAISIVAMLAILKQLDINLGPIVAGAGLATAALAFGAQNIVRDFLAGFFIVLEDQYGVGDVIDVGGADGMVESVSLRITRLRAADGTLWHVPNGEITSVANKSQEWSRAVIEFRLDIGVDIPAAIRVMKAEADDMWQDSAYAGIVLEEPELWGPEEIGPYGILLKLAVKTKPLEQWQISRTLRSRVKRALDDNGIAIAPLPIASQAVPAPKPHPGK